MGPTVTTSAKSSSGKNANAKKRSSASVTTSIREVKGERKKEGGQLGQNARSEIDDIFSGGGKVGESVSSSSVVVKKKKKKSKPKKEAVEGDGEDEEWTGFGGDTTPNSTPNVETVLDPSTRQTSTVWDSKKRKRVDGGDVTSVNKKQSKVKNDDEGERFRDSRGSGPRRQTEEGYAIYKEDELGIRDAGGVTNAMKKIHRCVLLIVIAVFNMMNIRLRSKFPKSAVFKKT